MDESVAASLRERGPLHSPGAGKNCHRQKCDKIIMIIGSRKRIRILLDYGAFGFGTDRARP
jgi:hypothetical protein